MVQRSRFGTPSLLISGVLGWIPSLVNLVNDLSVTDHGLGVLKTSPQTCSFYIQRRIQPTLEIYNIFGCLAMVKIYSTKYLLIFQNIIFVFQSLSFQSLTYVSPKQKQNKSAIINIVINYCAFELIFTLKTLGHISSLFLEVEAIKN